LLNRAIEIAVKGHRGQFDKAGKPYILHPLRVMVSLDNEDEMICAILHDIIEDTKIRTQDLISEGFDQKIIDAILSVTKSDIDTDYFDFIRRAKENPIGRKVKIADLKDNLNLDRISDPSPEDFRRIEKYRKALHILEADTMDIEA
jgi:(p)ppGpp synthase/HD superfamily hydrolase